MTGEGTDITRSDRFTWEQGDFTIKPTTVKRKPPKRDKPKPTM